MFSSADIKSSLSPLRRQREDTSSHQHQHQQQPHHVMTQPVFLQKILPYAANHLNSVATFKSVSSSWLETQVHYSGAILCWKAFIESGPRTIEKKLVDGSASSTVTEVKKPILRYVRLRKISRHVSVEMTNVDITSDFLHGYHTNELTRGAKLETAESIVESTKLLTSIDTVRALLYEAASSYDRRGDGGAPLIFHPYLLFNAASCGHFKLFEQLLEISETLDSPSTLHDDETRLPHTLSASSSYSSTTTVNDSQDRENAPSSEKNHSTARIEWLKALLTVSHSCSRLLVAACSTHVVSPIVPFILERVLEVDNQESATGESEKTHSFLRGQLTAISVMGFYHIPSPLMVACRSSTLETVRTIMAAICSLNDKQFLRMQLETPSEDSLFNAPKLSTPLSLVCWREPSEDTSRIINFLLETTTATFNDANEEHSKCLESQLNAVDKEYGHTPLLTALYRGQSPEVISALLSAIRRLGDGTEVVEHLFERHQSCAAVYLCDSEENGDTYRSIEKNRMGCLVAAGESYNAVNIAVLFSPLSTLDFLFSFIRKKFGTNVLLQIIGEHGNKEVFIDFDFYFEVTPFKCARTKEKIQFFVETFRQLGRDELLWQQLCYRSTTEGETVLMTIGRTAKDVSAVEYLLDVIEELGGKRFLRKQFEMKTTSGDSFWSNLAENKDDCYNGDRRPSNDRIKARKDVVDRLRARYSGVTDQSKNNISSYCRRCFKGTAALERKDDTQQGTDQTVDDDADSPNNNNNNNPLHQQNRRRERDDQEHQTDRHNVLQDAFFLKKILPFAADFHYSAAIFKGVCTSWQHVQTKCDGAALCWKAFIEEELFPENPDRAASILVSCLGARGEQQHRDYFYSDEYRNQIYHTAVAKEILAACVLMKQTKRGNKIATKVLLHFDVNMESTPLSQVCKCANLSGFSLLVNAAQDIGGDALEIRVFDNDQECSETPLFITVDSVPFSQGQFAAAKLAEKIFDRLEKLAANMKQKKRRDEFFRDQLTHRSCRSTSVNWTALATIARSGVQNDAMEFERDSHAGEITHYEDTFVYSTLKLLVSKLVEIDEYEKQYEKCEFKNDSNCLRNYLTACGFGEDFIASIRKSKE